MQLEWTSNLLSANNCQVIETMDYVTVKLSITTFYENGTTS